MPLTMLRHEAMPGAVHGSTRLSLAYHRTQNVDFSEAGLALRLMAVAPVSLFGNW